MSCPKNIKPTLIGELDVCQNARVQKKLSVCGPICSKSGDQSTNPSNGAGMVTGGVGIAKRLNVGERLTTFSEEESLSLEDGSIVSKGGLAVSKRLNVGNRITAISTEQSFSQTNGSIVTLGGVGIDKRLNVGERITGCSIEESNSTSSGSLVTKGGVGVAARLNVGGIVSACSTDESTSTASGSIITKGGVGVAKRLNVGGMATIASTIESSDCDNGALIVEGGVGVAKSLNSGIDVTAKRDVEAERYIVQSGSILVPAGVLMPFAGSTAPGGYLLCDGSAVQRSQYSDLFAAIGTSFGAGDGSTTFNLPDMRARVPLGVSGSHTLASQGGSASQTLSVSHLPAHTHTGTTNSDGAHVHSVSDPGHVHQTNIGRDDGNISNSPGQAPPGDSDTATQIGMVTRSSTTGISINSGGAHTHSFTTNATGSGAAFSIQNQYVALNYIIKQ